MAKVWYLSEGSSPAKGGPAHQVPFGECTFKLGPLFFLSEPSAAPKAPKGSVLVELDEAEPKKESKDWRPGFYLSRFDQSKAGKRLAS